MRSLTIVRKAARLLVLGEVAARALDRRQFYVGNTRYRGAHAIYFSNKDDILRRLTRPDAGRELATEFIERHRIVVNERFVPRQMRGMRAWMQAALAWCGGKAGHIAGSPRRTQRCVMDGVWVRKPKLVFDVVANPSHVTFDDGRERRRIIGLERVYLFHVRFVGHRVEQA